LKDFVDFIEIILRVATEDKILRDLKKIATTNTLAQVKDNFLKVCAHIEEDRGGTWDLEDIKREMDSRGLLSEFEWDEIPQTVEFFRTKVF
jgi:hypothetical protein